MVSGGGAKLQEGPASCHLPRNQAEKWSQKVRPLYACVVSILQGELSLKEFFFSLQIALSFPSSWVLSLSNISMDGDDH